jgi:hypothetical protein
MAFFGKNGQATVNSQEPATNIEIDGQETQPTALDLKQVETNIHQLAEKIQLGKEKNTHLIQTQKQQLEQLQRDYQGLNDYRGQIIGYLNGGGTNDPETFQKSAKEAEELNGKLADKKSQIDRIELDILLLQQQKDEESINEIVKEWNSYENEIFTKYISPLHKEVAAAKQFYFENLKQLREHYMNVERLAIQINDSLGDADKVTVHKWFNATLNNPELLITKYDEEKETAITHTYLAE